MSDTMEKKEKNYMNLTRQIRTNNNEQLKKLCMIAKTIYNDANHIKRKEYFDYLSSLRLLGLKQHGWASCEEVYEKLKKEQDEHEKKGKKHLVDIKDCNCVPVIIKRIEKIWTDFISKEEEYLQHPETDLPPPSIPSYLKSNKKKKKKCNSEVDPTQPCFAAVSIYNQIMYIKRQEFFASGKEVNVKKEDWIKLYHVMKDRDTFKLLPNDCTTMILRQIEAEWKGFFQAKKAWRKTPEKFRGKPQPPGFKETQSVAYFRGEGRQCKLKNNSLVFPSKTNSTFVNSLRPIKIADDVLPQDASLQQVRIIPRRDYHVIELVYRVQLPQTKLPQDRVLAIDIGVNNLMAVTNNVGVPPFLIKGNIVKSINQYFNKRRAKLTSINDLQQNRKKTTGRMIVLSKKREERIKWYFHNVSKYLIAYCVKYNIGRIAIGYNKGWKQEANMGKKMNQKFVQLPFLQLMAQMTYKGALQGIEVLTMPEPHTSKCSFLDDEEIKHHSKYQGRRVKRGMFKTKKNIYINSDINASYNIMRKAFPEVSLNKTDLRITPHTITIGEQPMTSHHHK